MDAATRSLIEALHRSPVKYVLAVTGGGTRAAAHLLSVPGGSRTVLEIIVPYNEHALGDFLGYRPEHFCSAETAQEMARRACERARWLAPGQAVAGVGCTASLATDRPKRGDHRFHIAIQTAERVLLHSLTLTKGARDREAEEAVLDPVLLNSLAEAFGLAERLPVALLPGEAVNAESEPLGGALAGFLRGEFNPICVDVDGRARADAPKPAALLPGSFNPVHEGHWKLADIAARRLGTAVAFELSVTNVDKPPLAADEIYRRIGQFTWRAPVWLTRAPTFAEKAALFPGTVFVVGADTAARIVDPHYYKVSETHMAEALAHFRAQGCRFLVAGRVQGPGAFAGLEEIALPDACRDLFADSPESEYRFDLSSTELRAQAAVAPPAPPD